MLAHWSISLIVVTKCLRPRVVSDLILVLLSYFLLYFWASDVQEHFNTAIRSQATAFHRYCPIGGFICLFGMPTRCWLFLSRLLTLVFIGYETWIEIFLVAGEAQTLNPTKEVAKAIKLMYWSEAYSVDYYFWYNAPKMLFGSEKAYAWENAQQMQSIIQAKMRDNLHLFRFSTFLAARYRI